MWRVHSYSELVFKSLYVENKIHLGKLYDKINLKNIETVVTVINYMMTRKGFKGKKQANFTTV